MNQWLDKIDHLPKRISFSYKVILFSAYCTGIVLTLTHVTTPRNQWMQYTGIYTFKMLWTQSMDTEFRMENSSRYANIIFCIVVHKASNSANKKLFEMVNHFLKPFIPCMTFSRLGCFKWHTDYSWIHFNTLRSCHGF